MLVMDVGIGGGGWIERKGTILSNDKERDPVALILSPISIC